MKHENHITSTTFSPLSFLPTDGVPLARGGGPRRNTLSWRSRLFVFSSQAQNFLLAIWAVSDDDATSLSGSLTCFLGST